MTSFWASRVELADSALHAPKAGFCDTDVYPDPYDKADVLAGCESDVLASLPSHATARGASTETSITVER